MKMQCGKTPAGGPRLLNSGLGGWGPCLVPPLCRLGCLSGSAARGGDRSVPVTAGLPAGLRKGRGGGDPLPAAGQGFRRPPRQRRHLTRCEPGPAAAGAASQVRLGQACHLVLLEAPNAISGQLSLDVCAPRDSPRARSRGRGPAPTLKGLHLKARRPLSTRAGEERDPRGRGGAGARTRVRGFPPVLARPSARSAGLRGKERRP